MADKETIEKICLIVEPPHWTRRSLGEPWLFDVIQRFPEIRFSLVVVGAGDIDEVLQSGYPANVESVQVANLDTGTHKGKKSKRVTQKKFARLVQTVAVMVENSSLGLKAMRETFLEISKVAPDMPFEEAWRDPVVWELITTACELHKVELPFTDFYEIVESVISPIWNLLSIAEEVSEADVYHGVGGSYAGLLSVILAEKNDSRSVFTDNRRAPARQMFRYFSEYWKVNAELQPRVSRLMDHEQLWMEKTYAFVCHCADQVVSGSSPAARLIAERAKLRKPVLRIGIGSDDENARRTRMIRRHQNGNEFLIGGVFERQSRSDVEMFLAAAHSVDQQFEGCRFHLWGNWNEEEKAHFLQLAEERSPIADVSFSSIESIEDKIGQIDIAVIPGQCEVGDQLLGMMFNAQIPVVATDVDKFSGILESLNWEGSHDFLIQTGAGDGSEMEEALLNLLSNHRLYEAAGHSARRHLNRNFYHDDMIADYGRVYQLIH